MSEYIPRLVYLVGLPGSGKSSITEVVKAGFEAAGREVGCISSDSIRKEIYGDENCQDNPSQVFNIMYQRTVQALKDGKNVIYDATNLGRKNRINFLKSIPKNIKFKKDCIIVWATVGTCIKRDAQRSRTVGKEVILKMLKRFETPWYDEGWDKITICRDHDDFYRYEDFDLSIEHDNPHHNNTIEQHIKNVVKEVEALTDVNLSDKNILLDIAKHHDLGKPITKVFHNMKGESTEIAHFYNHQNASAYFCLGIDTLTDDARALYISYLCNMHMEPFFNESKYFKNMDPELKKLVLTFNECDKRGA